MSIRKFRKNMKPFIFVLTVVFLLSLAFGGYESFMRSRVNKKAQEAFLLNGQYVQKVQIERAKNQLSELYSKFSSKPVDRDLLSVLAVKQVIDSDLSVDLAKKLKIKVSSSEVNKYFEDSEKAIGDKEQFKRMLEIQGYTKDSFKDMIERQLLIQKTQEYFINKVNPTEEQIQTYYNNNIQDKSKGIDAYKEQIINILKNTEGLKEYQSALFEARKNAKIEEVAPEYQNLLETTAYEEEGFKITNVDLAKLTIEQMLRGNMTKEDAEAAVKASIKEQVKIANEAKAKGVTVNENEDALTQIVDYKKGLFEKIKQEIKPTDDELKAFFDRNKKRYEISPSADAEIALVAIKPSQEDEKIAKSKAEEVLKEVTPESFEKKGEELAKNDDYIYQELGTFGKGTMVKEFEDAIKDAPSNSIVKNVVKTGYGYHVVYVQDNDTKNSKWTAAHIMVRVVPSKETVTKKMDEVNKLVDDINKGAVKFSEIQKYDKDIIQSQTLKALSPLDNNLGKTIFEAPLNKAEVIDNKDGVIIFKKIKQVDYQAPDFEKSKEQVKADYINQKAAEKM